MEYLVIGQCGAVDGAPVRGMRNTRAPVESFLIIDDLELKRLESLESVTVYRQATKAKIRRDGRAEWLPLVAVSPVVKPLPVESVVINIEVDLREGRESAVEVRRVVVGLVRVVFRDAKIS